MPRPWTACAVIAAVALVASCDTDDGRALRDPPPGATAPTQPPVATATSAGDVIVGQPPVGSAETATMALGSTAFANGTPIPVDHSCDGANLSPPLHWSAVPADAVELALTVVDLDSAGGGQLVHWAVAGLDPTLVGLDTGVDVPAIGGVVARNYTTEFGWAGPCPPAGETHRYVFTLYALSSPSNVAADATGDDVVALLAGLGAVTTTLTGTYTGL